jgi:cell division protein FtsB
MVVRTRLRSFFRQLGLFIAAAAAISYFGFHAFSGNHGLMATRHYQEQKRILSAELDAVQAERAALARRVTLLKSNSIDPDTLEDEAREMLGLTHKSDVVVLLPP